MPPHHVGHELELHHRTSGICATASLKTHLTSTPSTPARLASSSRSTSPSPSQSGLLIVREQPTMPAQPPLPAPRPLYVFRAHTSAVHAVQFSADNGQLLSADADGWIICWDMAYKRAVARWRAHGAESNDRSGGDSGGSNAVLGLAWWGTHGVMSHGRDSLIKFWQLDPSSSLPLMNLSSSAASAGSIPSSKTPALVHSLPAPTVNFCSFAYCFSHHRSVSSTTDPSPPIHVVASSSSVNSALSLYALTHPSPPELVSTIPPMTNPDVGMAMALALPTPQTIIAGFESGHVVVWYRSVNSDEKWNVSYLSRPHSQPILSLTLHPSRRSFVTSSADAVVAKHLLPSYSTTETEEADVEEVISDHPPPLSDPLEIIQTKHAGQQGLSVRGDGKLLTSAGWDARGRVYSYGSIEEPASTEEVSNSSEPKEQKERKRRKKMKEIAVLAWHKGSVYCSAFSNIQNVVPSNPSQPQHTQVSSGQAGSEVITTNSRRSISVSARREKEVQDAKLIALGGKDGKVSLWEMDIPVQIES